jgi:hypothetical protein
MRRYASDLQTTTRRSRAISRSVSDRRRRRRRGGTFTLAAGTVELDADPTADGLVLRIGGSFRDSRFPTGWLASCAWMFWACESGLILLSVGLGMSRFRFGFGLVFGVVHDDVVVPRRRLLYLIMRHGIDPLLRSRMHNLFGGRTTKIKRVHTINVQIGTIKWHTFRASKLWAVGRQIQLHKRGIFSQ